MIHRKEGIHIFQRQLAIDKESKRGKYEGDKTQQDDIIKTKEGSHIIKTAGEKYKDKTDNTTQEGDVAIEGGQYKILGGPDLVNKIERRSHRIRGGPAKYNGKTVHILLIRLRR